MTATFGIGLRVYCAITAFVFAVCMGCGGTDRLDVSGNVTCDGQPLPNGEIVFVPEASGGFMATAQIENGRFQIPAEFGPSPGSYLVRITAYKKTGREYAANPLLEDQSNAETLWQYLPARYNDTTMLTAKIEKGAENLGSLNFDLTTSPDG